MACSLLTLTSLKLAGAFSTESVIYIFSSYWAGVRLCDLAQGENPLFFLSFSKSPFKATRQKEPWQELRAGHILFDLSLFLTQFFCCTVKFSVRPKFSFVWHAVYRRSKNMFIPDQLLLINCLMLRWITNVKNFGWSSSGFHIGSIEAEPRVVPPEWVPFFLTAPVQRGKQSIWKCHGDTMWHLDRKYGGSVG